MNLDRSPSANKKWLMKINFTRADIVQLSKCILYLKEMNPEDFKDQH